MTEFVKILIIVGPALLVGVLGTMAGTRFVDRKFRINAMASDPTRPVLVRLDEGTIKPKLNLIE